MSNTKILVTAAVNYNDPSAEQNADLVKRSIVWSKAERVRHGKTQKDRGKRRV